MAIGGAALIAKMTSEGHEGRGSTEDPAPIDDKMARAHCIDRVPEICRAVINCTPGFHPNPTRKSDAVPDQAVELKSIADAAFSACKRQVEADECDGPSYEWKTATDYELTRCFTKPQCDCDMWSPCKGELKFDADCPHVSASPWQFLDLDAASLDTALAFSLPYGSGEVDADAPTTSTFMGWARKHLTWSMVSVGRPSTKPALVMKDPLGAYGKMLCASGLLIQIYKRYSADFESIISLDDFSTVRLLAVKSTGELVEQNRARFCGVVMGTYSYKNRQGNERTAVDVVGMFDLPENRDTPH